MLFDGDWSQEDIEVHSQHYTFSTLDGPDQTPGHTQNGLSV